MIKHFFISSFNIIFIISFLTSCSLNTKAEKQNILDKILKSGKLVVGSTGDYPPFSLYEDKTKRFSGMDLRLAQNLADSLNVELEIYHTSWKNLLTDLDGNKFDIALSGISKKLSRQRVGFFSKGYINNGKIPIAKCVEKKSYKNLSMIDLKHVKVIVNPGGTNEKFLKKNIKNAQIIMFKDNRYIFEEILNGRVDLMITDSVEAFYQSRKHKGKLCVTMDMPLTSGEIAALMPRDIIWKEYVDTWLSLIKKNGLLKKLMDN